MRLRDEWSFLLAVLAGTALRLDQIGIQIPLDDEWHALHAVERFGYAHVATHFGWTDYCIPLTLFDKLIADTVGLSELWLRLPVVVAGLVSLVLMPLVVRPWVGRETSSVFAWLLAVSPLHVYFTRYARPYSIALLLAFLAVFALPRATLAGGRGWRWVYAGAAVLAPYFHLTTLPVVLLPLAIVWVVRWRAPRREEGLSTRTLSIVTLAVAAGLGVLLGPPMLVDHQALAYKAGRGEVHAEMLAGAASLMAGSARASVIVVTGIAVVGGAVALGRRHPRLLALLGAVAALAIGMPLATHPALIELPIVFVRYALIVLPLALLLAACAIEWAVARAGRRNLAAASVAGPLIAVVLVALGPLPHIDRRPNAWTNHPAFQYSYVAPPCDPGYVVLPFYALLAREPPGSERLVEAPWLFAAAGNRFHCAQLRHRQDVRIGFVGGVFDGAAKQGLPRPGELPILAQPHRYRFRTFLHLGDADGLRRSGATLVVLHKRIEKEMTGAATDSGLGIEPWIARYRASYGAPVYEDEWMAVFRVAG